VDECEPLPVFCSSAANATVSPTVTQGRALIHFRAQLEDLRDTSLTLQLNLSTFGTHPRVILGTR